MQKSPPISLRERNRLETWVAIHDTAATLALRDGLAQTTVDAISAAVGISNRTFFNYFATKEDAVLGARTLEVSDVVGNEFRDGTGDVFTRTVQLLTSVIRTATPSQVPLERRLQLIRRFPELRSRLAVRAAGAEELIEPILIEEFARQEEAGTARPEVRAGTPLDANDNAKALVMLAGTIIRFAYAKDPAAISTSNSAALTDAITTFREVFARSQ